MLLFLLKHSSSCLSNPVCELAKHLDKVNNASFKDLLCIIKFMLDMHNYGLKIKPKIVNMSEPWSVTIFCDSDYAGDMDIHISMTGYCPFLMGVPVSWKSCLQKSVTLSLSKAEFVASLEAAQEVKFVVQVLQLIGIKEELPMVVQVDNIGAIFIAENVTTSQCMKHIDACYHNIREFIEDGFIKLIFVRMRENTADVFTKNTSGDTYDRHMREIKWNIKNIQE